MLGSSVATRVLHNAPCSILLARRRSDLLPARIVVGTDGSAHATRAVHVAAELAQRLGVELRCVCARHDETGDLGDLPPCTEIVVGRGAASALAAECSPDDLLVVGSGGRRGVRALGSTSERVAHEAPCSVLVVRGTPVPEATTA